MFGGARSKRNTDFFKTKDMKIDLSRNILSYQVIRMWKCNVCGHSNEEELTTCKICGAFIEETDYKDIEDEFLDEEDGLLQRSSI